MILEIDNLKFSLDEIADNPEKIKLTEEEIFAQFASSLETRSFSFVRQDRLESIYRVNFTGKPGVTIDDLVPWLHKRGFVGFRLEGEL